MAGSVGSLKVSSFSFCVSVVERLVAVFYSHMRVVACREHGGGVRGARI